MFYIINTLQYMLYKEFPQHKIYRYLHFYYNINVITPYIPIQNTRYNGYYRVSIICTHVYYLKQYELYF